VEFELERIKDEEGKAFVLKGPGTWMELVVAYECPDPVKCPGTRYLSQGGEGRLVVCSDGTHTEFRLK
jgi:hypothetical protein